MWLPEELFRGTTCAFASFSVPDAAWWCFVTSVNFCLRCLCFLDVLISTSPAALITTPLDQQNNAVDKLHDFFSDLFKLVFWNIRIWFIFSSLIKLSAGEKSREGWGGRGRGGRRARGSRRWWWQREWRRRLVGTDDSPACGVVAASRRTSDSYFNSNIVDIGKKTKRTHTHINTHISMVHTLCHNVPKGDFCLRILPVIRYPLFTGTSCRFGFVFVFFTASLLVFKRRHECGLVMFSETTARRTCLNVRAKISV